MSGTKNYLRLIVLHCNKIFSRIKDVTFNDWHNDILLQDAVCFRLLALSECVKKYQKENPILQTEHPEIPWNDIIRLYDKILHHYHDVDSNEIWGIIISGIIPLYNVIHCNQDFLSTE